MKRPKHLRYKSATYAHSIGSKRAKAKVKPREEAEADARDAEAIKKFLTAVLVGNRRRTKPQKPKVKP